MERRHPVCQPMIQGKEWRVGGGFVATTIDTWGRDFLEDVFVGQNAGIFDNVELLPSSGPVEIKDSAVVYGKAKIRTGHIKIYGSAKVYDEATIGSEESHEIKLTEVYDNAEVYENAKVYDYAKASGNTKIHGNAQIYGKAKIFGDAEVSGNTKIYDSVEISGNVRISGDTEICGKLKISGDFEIDGGIYYNGGEVTVNNKEELEKYKCKNQNELKRKQDPLAELEDLN